MPDLEPAGAVVLAGSSGLGLACATSLLASGHGIVLCGRDGQRASSAAAELGGPPNCIGMVADVRNRDQVHDVFATAAEAFGAVSTVVVNAGGPPPGSFETLERDRWDHAYELTLMSAVVAIEEALVQFEGQPYGRIVIIGSSSVRRPIPGLTLSNVFRSAINGLVKDLAPGLAERNITINMVSPGRFDTARVRSLDEQSANAEGISPEVERANARAAIPAKRYGDPSEFGDLVAHIAAPGSSYLTGQSILIDGGLVNTMP